jgi:CheY-like chemotaxis protein
VREENEMKTNTILIIEDNALNMKLARSLLNVGNFLTLEALNAEDGIKLAKEHLPDLILMDIQLPGINGLEATSRLKSNDHVKHIPIIALTSYAMQGDEEKALQAGCTGYITKPIDTRKFLKTIEHYLS